MRITVTSVLFAIALWSMLLLRFGYRYGTGDQVELLPYVNYLHNPGLYTNDFFIKGLHAAQPNERTVMAYLLLPFANHLEVTCFILQMLCTVLLVLGLEQLALRFIKNKYAAWLAIATALIPLNDYGLGNVEVYSECLQASGLATAMVVWGLLFFMDRRFIMSSILMSAATVIQLLDGLDVMLVLCLIAAGYLLKGRYVKPVIAFVAIFAATAGVYLVGVLFAKTGPRSTGISNALVFDILFRFRHPHHFIFASFPLVKTLVFFVLSLFALGYFYRQCKMLFAFILIGLGGIIVYALATDVMHIVPLANFQFYKISQWMKFLGVVAVFAAAEHKLNLRSFNLQKWQEAVGLSFIPLVCFVVIVWFCNLLPFKVPYQMFRLKQNDDMIAICQQAAKVTPLNAVFVQPFDNTELKFYARRSSYVEFKANVRHKDYVGEWYSRILQVYGVSINDGALGFKLQQKADSVMANKSINDWNALKQKGVTHALVKESNKLPVGTCILSNHSYAVYQL